MKTLMLLPFFLHCINFYYLNTWYNICINHNEISSYTIYRQYMDNTRLQKFSSYTRVWLQYMSIFKTPEPFLIETCICAVCSIQWAVCSVQFVVCSLRCEVCGVKYAVFSVNLKFAVSIMQCAVCSV